MMLIFLSILFDFDFLFLYSSREDSTIVAPYNKWIYYDPRIKQREQLQNYAENKTKKVAWFVSNCVLTSNNRLEYAKELQKYIQVGEKNIGKRYKKFLCELKVIHSYHPRSIFMANAEL